MEAMGCGLPVIGARSGAVEELLRHGENSLTYPSGDAEQLAARIQELLVSPALRIQMAEAAQADVLATFNETNVINQIENFLSNSQAQTG
jgi:1,4-alpha-glucan branching enzyme